MHVRRLQLRQTVQSSIYPNLVLDHDY